MLGAPPHPTRATRRSVSHRTQRYGCTTWAYKDCTNFEDINVRQRLKHLWQLCEVFNYTYNTRWLL